MNTIVHLIDVLIIAGAFGLFGLALCANVFIDKKK
jgi:hypothetical protein